MIENMRKDPSRRLFLAASLGAPALGAVQPLRYRTLGKTGLKVTELGLGCSSVSDISVLRTALDLGINFFDTARSYESGNSETLLAKALGSRRKDIILASRSYADDAKTIAADLDASLKALGTDYLDIWYIGNKDKPGAISAAMLEVQTQAQKQGRIRFKGLSTHRLNEILAFATAPGRFDVLLAGYNFTMGTQFDGALDAMNKAGLGVVAMKVMAGGAWRTLRPSTRVPALKWALRKPWIHTTIVTMRDQEALRENMRAMSESFTDQDRLSLSTQIGELGPLVCRMCGRCDGACPRGLPVADLVRFAAYAEGYGDYRLGRVRYDALPAEVRAVRCDDCARCAVRCPNGVHVRERAARAQELFA